MLLRERCVARSDSGHRTMEDGVTTLRRVWVWLSRLKLSGFADVVEESEGQLTPIEYKKGKMGEWLNDHVQLCAQALCLEEMSGCSISHGYIFYFGSARREEVVFTEALRQHTEETVRLAFSLLERGILPPPLSGKQTRRSGLLSMHKVQAESLAHSLLRVLAQCLGKNYLFTPRRAEIEDISMRDRTSAHLLQA